MSKKKIIIISVVALIIAVIGFLSFFGDDLVEYLNRKTFQRLFALEKDYSLQSESGGVYLVNEKDGFMVKLPEDWKLAPGTDFVNSYSESEIMFLSPDYSFRPPKGCTMTVQITRGTNFKEREYFINPTIDKINEILELAKEGTTTEGYPSREVVIISGIESLKEAFPPYFGVIRVQYTRIEIPTYSRIYSFDLVSSTEECDKEFEDVLNSVSIKQL